MRTERQKQAARANGAKSRGPITPEGKLASSRNASTHGILSGTVVLQGESEERFHALLADLHAELQPQTTVEFTLVENMAVARWRQMRIWGIEKANMEQQMRAQVEQGVGEDEDNATRCALAFRTLGDDSRSLELINRYESRFDRQYLRAHRRFLELVDRRTPPPAPAPKNAGPSVQTPGPQLVPPPAQNVPQPGNTVSAKQTRELTRLIPTRRLAAAACAIILSAISFLPSVTGVSGPVTRMYTGNRARIPLVSDAMTNWIDISVPVRNGMVHWPGDPAFHIERALDQEKGDTATVSKMTLGVHTGTHMDAPLHFIRNAISIDRMPLDATMGRARVIRIDDAKSIRREELLGHAISAGERILFKTANSDRAWDSDTFDENFVFIAQDGARYLAECGVRCVGVDYLSVGGFREDGPETHHALLEAGIWIIEGLNLQGVAPGEYELACLPLKLTGSEGAPARAILKGITS